MKLMDKGFCWDPFVSGLGIKHLQAVCLYEEKSSFLLSKLDGLGPVDDRPSHD